MVYCLFIFFPNHCYMVDKGKSIKYEGMVIRLPVILFYGFQGLDSFQFISCIKKLFDYKILNFY